MEKYKKGNSREEHDHDARFAGVLGEDYNLRPLAMPYHERFQNTLKNMLREFATDHQDVPTLNVLEAGCGTGLSTIKILDADPRIKILAVDNEEKTIHQAEQVLNDLKERIKFRYGDILAVLKEQKDVSFDAFASALTIHNFSDEYRREVLKEVFRVLKNKGLFINTDKYALNDPEAHAKSLEEQIKSFDVYDTIGRPDVKEAWTKHYEQDEKTKITEQEQIDLLEKLGFEDIKVVFRESMEAVITAKKQ